MTFTFGEIIAIISVALTLIGLAVGFWRYIEGKLIALFRRADSADKALDAHKLHVAETYVSKQGLRETKDEILAGIGGLRTAVDRMNERVDRIVEQQSTRRPD